MSTEFGPFIYQLIKKNGWVGEFETSKCLRMLTLGVGGWVYNIQMLTDAYGAGGWVGHKNIKAYDCLQWI